jgi:hypothetical protein
MNVKENTHVFGSKPSHGTVVGGQSSVDHGRLLLLELRGMSVLNKSSEVV